MHADWESNSIGTCTDHVLFGELHSSARTALAGWLSARLELT